MNEDDPEIPDEELIRRIRQKKTSPDMAKNAFSIFYRRYVQFVLKNVRFADSMLVGYAIGHEDIVEAVFSRIWDGGAPSFGGLKTGDRETEFRRTCLWLTTIAKNLIKDRLKSPKRIHPVDPFGDGENLFKIEADEKEIDKKLDDQPIAEQVETQTKHRALRVAVAELLNDRDQAIVWFKIQHYDKVTGKSEPPQEELAAFCEKWKIKPPALRKAYERALEKIEPSLSSFLDTRPALITNGASHAAKK
jgi:DNA-directed RNA polymerase specialized sigma24 family protein